MDQDCYSGANKVDLDKISKEVTTIFPSSTKDTSGI